MSEQQCKVEVCPFCSGEGVRTIFVRDSMNAPRAYDLSQPGEQQRLLRELCGFMQISQRDGTDATGRMHAYEALRSLKAHDWQFPAASGNSAE